MPIGEVRSQDSAGQRKFVYTQSTSKLVRDHVGDTREREHTDLAYFEGLSIITDLICSLLPIAIMWNVQLPFRKKVSIWALMAMGIVCTVCSAVRAKSLNSKAKDIAYEYSIVAIWAM